MVMSALAEREFYGYELVEHIVSRCGLAITDGTLYAILTRLKGEAFVRARWEHAEKGPGRKYYALTKEGRAALAAMRRVWTEIVHGIAQSQSGGSGDVQRA